MASCDLTIELDSPEASFRAGEQITGRVVVRVDAQCRCDGLKVGVAWFTHGKGNRAHKAVSEQALFTGQWNAGDRQVYPFRLTAPAEPRAYAGELLNIDWRVEATADIPWAFDPKAETPIVISHPAPPRGLVVAPRQNKNDGWSGTCLGMSVALLLASAALFAAAFGGAEPAFGFGCTLVAFGLIGFFVSIGRYLAEKKLGAVKVSITQGGASGYREASRADTLFCSIRVKPGVPLQAVTVSLEVREEVVRGSGSNKRTFRHPFYTSTAMLTESEPGHYTGRLQLPEPGSVPYSWTAPSNKLLWEAEVHVDVADWPDWKEKLVLQARPEG